MNPEPSPACMPLTLMRPGGAQPSLPCILEPCPPACPPPPTVMQARGLVSGGTMFFPRVRPIHLPFTQSL